MCTCCVLNSGSLCELPGFVVLHCCSCVSFLDQKREHCEMSFNSEDAEEKTKLQNVQIIRLLGGTSESSNFSFKTK